MTLEILVRPEAEHDLMEAAAWYEQQQAGLGYRFSEEIETTFARISRHPYSYETLHRGTRRALLRRFPFGIFYRVEDAGIVILAVMHASRDPRRWRDRL